MNLNMKMTTEEAYMVMFKDYPDVVDVVAMSQMLGVCTKTGYKLLNEGTIKSLRVGRTYKIPKLFIIEYLLSFKYVS